MKTTLKILTAATALLTAIAAPAAAQVVDYADQATKLARLDIGHEAIVLNLLQFYRADRRARLAAGRFQRGQRSP